MNEVGQLWVKRQEWGRQGLRHWQMGTPISTYRYFITTFAWQCGKVGEHKKLQTRNSLLCLWWKRKKQAQDTQPKSRRYTSCISQREKYLHVCIYMKRQLFFLQQQRHLCVFMQRAPNCFGQSGKTSWSCNFGCTILTRNPLTPVLTLWCECV